MTVSSLWTLREGWYDNITLQLPRKQGQVGYNIGCCSTELSKHTPGAQTTHAPSEYMYQIVFTSTHTWEVHVSTRSTTFDDVTVTWPGCHTNVHNFCSLPNPLLASHVFTTMRRGVPSSIRLNKSTHVHISYMGLGYDTYTAHAASFAHAQAILF